MGRGHAYAKALCVLCRSSEAPSFESLGVAYGENPPTVILKSMGKDGLTNCQHAAAASGTVGLQDAPRSACRSMRGVAAQAEGRI